MKPVAPTKKNNRIGTLQRQKVHSRKQKSAQLLLSMLLELELAYNLGPKLTKIQNRKLKAKFEVFLNRMET